MNAKDFINIRSQQSFLENSINPNRNKNRKQYGKKHDWKIQKKPAKFTLKGWIFSGSVQNNFKKIFITTTGLLDAKYSLINGKIYQAIGVINLNEINGWEKSLKTSRWGYVSFQSQLHNSQTQHIASNFATKNAGDIMDFGIKLIEDNNKEIEFADGEKKFPIVHYLIEFIAWTELIRKNKKAERNILKTC